MNLLIINLKKDRIDNIVDRQLSKIQCTKSFAHEFNKKYSNKRDSWQLVKIIVLSNYLWKDFSKYNALINNVFKLPKSNFTESYADSLSILLLKQVKFSETN